MPQLPLNPLSDALFTPLSRAFKVGGLGLAFLALGAFLMLVAFFLPQRGQLSYVVLGTGFVLISFTCVLFFLQDVRPLFLAQARVSENRELIDAVQVAALQVTEIASAVQSLAFKHASTVAATLQLLRPQLRQVPLIGKLADSEVVLQTDRLSSAIVDYTGKAKQVIGDLEKALIDSDPKALKAYTAELSAVRGEIEQLLRAG